MADAAYARLKRQSLVFVLPAVLGVLALLALVAWKQGLLAATRPLYVMTDSAAGITQGMPVKLNGFIVGQVTGIQLLPPSTQSAERVRVSLEVLRRYLDYIPRTSRARLAQEGLIGQSVIEIVPQRFDARAIRAGEVLPFGRSRGMADIASGLEDRLTPVLDNSRLLTARLADPQGELQGMLAAGRDAARDLSRTSAQAQATLAQAQLTMNALGRGADASLQRVDRTLAHVERDVPALLDTLAQTAANARDASEDVAALTRRSSEQLPRILDHAEQATEQGQALVEDVRGAWPLRALRREPTDALAPADSLDGLVVPAPSP